jgi:hypothetical protein
MRRNHAGKWAGGKAAALAGGGALLAAVCVGSGAAWWHSKTGAAVGSPAAPSPRAAFERAEHADPLWYFRSGQCRADARSLVEALRFILEPDSDSENPPRSISPANGPAENSALTLD